MKLKSLPKELILILRVILVGVFYFIAALISFLTILTPINIQAFWAPAGIAQAAVLIWGGWMGIGVFFGALLTFLWFLNTPLTALSLAIGGLLQALAASWLIKRYVKFLPPRTSQQTLLAIGLSAASALLAPLFGLLARCYLGLLPWSEFLHQFWLLWLSAMVGILIFTPALVFLSIRAQKQPLANLAKNEPFLWLLASVLMGVTLLSVLLLSNSEQKRTQEQNQRDTAELGRRIQESINYDLKDLNAFVGFYKSSKNVTRAEFLTFASSLITDSPDTSMFSWMPWVPDKDRLSYEQNIHTDGLLSYRILEKNSAGDFVSARNRLGYYPIEIVQSANLGTVTENGQAAVNSIIGFDFGSFPQGLNAIEIARESGKPVAIILEEPQTLPIIHLLLPVFQNNSSGSTQGTAPSVFKGLVGADYKVNSLLATALNTHQRQDLEVYLFDLTENPIFLAFSPSLSGPQILEGGKTPVLADLLAASANTAEIKIADRKLLLVTRPGVADVSFTDESINSLVLLIGFGISIVFLFFVDTRQKSEAVLAQSEAEFRTLSDNALTGVMRLSLSGEINYANQALAQLLGFVLAEHVVNTNFLQYINDPAQNGFLAEIRKETEELGQKKIIRELEIRTTGGEAKIRQIVFSASLQSDIIIATIFDISERKQAALLQETVFAIADDARNCDSLSELYPLIQQRISNVMYARNFYIALYDEKTDRLSFVYSVDENGTYDPTPFKPQKGLTELVLHTGKPLFCDDLKAQTLQQDGNYSPRGINSSLWLGVPLNLSGKTFGVMAVQHYHDPTAFNQREQHILEYVSSQVAIAIDRKQKEEEARLVQTRNSALIQLAPDGIVMVNSAGAFTFGSPSAFRMFGYKPDEVLGAASIDFVHPDDVQLVHASFKNLRNNPEKFITIQYRFRHQNGTYHWIESTLSNLLDEPAVNAVVVNFRDITEKKQAGELLQKSQSSLEMAQSIAHLGSWEIDRNNGAAYWSDEMYKLFRRERAQSLPTFTQWLRHVHPEDRQSILDAMWLSSNEHVPVSAGFRVKFPSDPQSVGISPQTTPQELGRYPRELGSYPEQIFYYEMRIMARLDEEGKLISISGTVMDVSERHAMEQENRQRVKELTCLYNVARLLEGTHHTERGVCSQIVQELVQAMQFPQLVAAQIELNNQTYNNENKVINKDEKDFIGEPRFLAESPHLLVGQASVVEAGGGGAGHTDRTPAFVARSVADINIAGKYAGRLSVIQSHGEAFVPEEQDLVDNLARMLSQWLERVQSEKALRISNARFSQLAENIQEVFWMYDNQEQKMIYVSPAYEKVWGNSIQSVFDDTRSYKAGVLEADLHLMTKGEEQQALAIATDIEYRLLRPDGSVRWVWDRGFPIFDEDGKFFATAGVATDITELKHAQLALQQLNNELEQRVEERTAQVKQSEATYRALFENSNDGIFIMSPEGVELRANQKALDMLGFTEADWQTINNDMVVTPEEQLDSRGKLAAVVRGEKVPLYERTIVCKNGNKLAVEINLSSIRDTDGNAIFVQSVVRDITERKRTEESLRTNSELFDKFMRYSPIYAFVKEVTAERSRVLYSSENYTDMIGIPGSKMVGQTMHDLFSKESADIITADDWHVVSKGEMITIEEEQDGRKYTSIKFPIIQGERTLLAGYTIDNTDIKKSAEILRESEERYRRAISAADAVPYSTDYATDSYLFIGEGIERLTGYSLEEITPPFLKTIILEINFAGELAKYPDSHEAVEFLLKTGQIPVSTVWRSDYKIMNKSGEIRWLSDASIQVTDKNGHITGSIGILQDITDRKQDEVELRESRDKLSAANSALEKASRMKDEFLASMSHELRTPLTGILGLSEALQMQNQGTLNDKQLNSLRNIEKSGRHLLELINDILDLSKIEAGKLELQMDICLVSDVCHASLQLVKGMAHQKKQSISFEMNIPPFTMQADTRRLKQMLVNLLSNAIKFTPAGGKIGLFVEALKRERIIRFSVRDKGIGIRAEDLTKLFKPFVQLDSSLSRQYSGTGLGLSLVQRMAELHGGTVEVESVFGEGSEFTIILPWVSDDDDDDDAVGVGLKPVPTQSLKAPVMDLDLKRIVGYLEQQHIHTSVHFDLNNALEQAQTLKPAAILLDLDLPNGAGLEMLRRLKDVGAPVLVTSAQNIAADAMRAGAALCLPKPFSMEELRDAVLAVGAGEIMVIWSHVDSPLVLVTDDNELILETISEFLLVAGFRVITAQSGFEMLEKAVERRPDVILVDIQMSGMDGMQAMKSLRAHADKKIASTLMIAITALAMRGDRERCLAAGANEYLSKPVELKLLVKLIAKLLGAG